VAVQHCAAQQTALQNACLCHLAVNSQGTWFVGVFWQVSAKETCNLDNTSTSFVGPAAICLLTLVVTRALIDMHSMGTRILIHPRYTCSRSSSQQRQPIPDATDQHAKTSTNPWLQAAGKHPAAHSVACRCYALDRLGPKAGPPIKAVCTLQHSQSIQEHILGQMRNQTMSLRSGSSVVALESFCTAGQCCVPNRATHLSRTCPGMP
jgi:hypothetical protein